MPGSNFNNVLPINAAGELSPSGPLVLKAAAAAARGPVQTELYVWVLQRKAGGKDAFMQSKGVPQAGGMWSAPGAPAAGAAYDGNFGPGKAVGIAVQISKGGNQTWVSWWRKKILIA